MLGKQDENLCHINLDKRLTAELYFPIQRLVYSGFHLESGVVATKASGNFAVDFSGEVNVTIRDLPLGST